NRLDSLKRLQVSDTLQQLKSAIAEKLGGVENVAVLSWLDSLEDKTRLSPRLLSKWDSLKNSIKDPEMVKLLNEYEQQLQLPEIRVKELDKLQNLQQK